MRIFFSKTVGVLFIITMVFMYGCEQSSVNSEPDINQELKPIPTATHTPTAANDGLEPVNFNIPAGTDFVTAGTGTMLRAEESISVVVPAGATVEAVYLYWARLDNDIDNPPQAPSTILVNGAVFTGSVVGGPVDNPSSGFAPLETKAGITHRVNLTNAGLISPGMNTFTVQDDFSNPSGEADPLGASVIVFYSEAGQDSEVVLFDGVDYLWAEAPGDNLAQRNALRVAAPVTFMFDAADVDRTAQLALFIGDIEPADGAERPNSLMITVGDGPTVTLGPTPNNPFQGFQGAEWDNFVTSFSIPAGVDNVTVEPVSGPDIDPSVSPASLVWSLAGLSVPIPQEGGGGEGCTPGYWKQDHHFDSWVTYSPGDDLTDTFGSSDYDLAKPERGTADALSLLQGLELRGGKVNALTRHAVAALLNAANPDVSYDLSESEVIAKFNAAVEDGGKKAIEKTKNEFESFNEQGCPLN